MIVYKSKKKKVNAQNALTAGTGISSGRSIINFTTRTNLQAGGLINCQGFSTALFRNSSSGSYATIFVISKDGTKTKYHRSSTTDLSITLSANDTYIVCTQGEAKILLQ